ncbi:pyroglutamyl-peptidase I [Halostagnicola bangensis]
MSTVLLTGYEPFGEFETNPAKRLAERLDGTEIADAAIVGVVLPVTFDLARDRLEDALEKHDPDIVCSLGLAAGRNTLSLERVGINCRDTTTSGIPDNADREVADEPVVEDGPAAYFATLPLREMKTAMIEAGVPTTRSSDAGTHLCNNLLYTARYLAEMSACPAEFDSGFIHVPFSHEQAARRDDGEPSMSVETMECGLISGLKVAVERTTRS